MFTSEKIADVLFGNRIPMFAIVSEQGCEISETEWVYESYRKMPIFTFLSLASTKHRKLR